MLRHQSDIKTLIYGLLICPGLLFINWKLGLSPYLLITYPILIFFGFTTALMAHNHNHLPTFKSNLLNELWSHWLSFFYGHPVFVWIPVHNMNHHVHTNSKEDWSCTYRWSNKNNLWSLISYFFSAQKLEGAGYIAYLKRLRVQNPQKFKAVIRMYLVFITFNALFLLLNPWKAFFFIIVPGQVTIFLIHVMNYIQHVDTDHEDDDNYARNFVHPIANFLMFNGGFHTAHHNFPATHWSQYPRLHQQVVDKIDPQLIEQDPFWYCIKTYLLGIRPKPLVDVQPFGATQR